MAVFVIDLGGASEWPSGQPLVRDIFP